MLVVVVVRGASLGIIGGVHKSRPEAEGKKERERETRVFVFATRRGVRLVVQAGCKSG